MSHPPSPARRSVLRGALAASAAVTLPTTLGAAPAFARSGRPAAPWGVQAGDVTAHSGLVWVRSDRPARMIVETAATESFRQARRWHGPLLGPGTDLTGTTRLHGLPAGEQIHYRVLLADPDDPRRTGEPVTGTFRTTPAGRRRGVRFLWSGDLAGQGWGINPDLGGYRIYDAMARLDPDFFLCSGDSIYADGPISATAALPDGSTWRNVTTEEKSKVAETLAEYRGNFRYNLLDDNLRRFNAQVPSIVQWDDHEVRNNWYPGEVIADSVTAYREKRLDVLAARARRAFSEYFPISTLPPGDRNGRVYRVMRHGPLLDVFVLDMRTYRDANSPGTQASDPVGILGAEQLAWLKRELARSRAVWKVIAADMPLGLVVPDTTEGRPNFEAVAQGDPGRPRPGTADRGAAAVRQAPADHRHGVAYGGRAPHLGTALPALASGVHRLRAVLGVRLGPSQRGRLPGERAGRHVRSRAGVREGAHRLQRVARAGLPVLRRGRHRRRQRGVDGAAARTGRHGAFHPGAAAGAGGSVTPPRPAWWRLA